MAQGVLSYKYEEEKTSTGMTALAGGDCVDDLKILEKDAGFCKVLGRVETKGLSRQHRRAMERRWRKEQYRSVPSPSPLFRYLEAFHDPLEEKKREKGKAGIPLPNQHLSGLIKVNRDFVASVQKRHPCTDATLDMDATLVATQKEDGLFSYKGYRAYQPFNVRWAEQECMLHTEFRDGNVPTGYEQLRLLKEALDLLPEGVKNVYLCSDTAGYQHDLLRYCEQGENKKTEGSQVFPHQLARTHHRPCAGTGDPARQGPPVSEGAARCTAADYGARSPAVRITQWKGFKSSNYTTEAPLRRGVPKNRPQKRLRPCLRDKREAINLL
jgi:hypothetical protein